MLLASRERVGEFTHRDAFACNAKESGEVSHYALSRAIPTPYWGVEYVLAFPHGLQCATVILLCKEAATVQLDLQGHKTDPNSVVVLEDGTVLETFAVYPLSLAARERYQITALNWDLTGSKLTGNQRFSVVVGPRNIETSYASCTNEPFAMEQMMPTFSWGSEYIIPAYEYYLVTVRLVTLEEENTVDYRASITLLGALVLTSSNVLATIGEDLTYTLTDQMQFDVIRSTKPLMVVVTYGSPELEDIAFTQITPLSHFPDRAMITLTESSLFEIVVAFNVGCLPKFSDQLYDNRIATSVGLTRLMISFLKDPPVGSSVIDSFSVGTSSSCSGLLALVLASLPGGAKPVLAANPAGWILCPEGQSIDVNTYSCTDPTSDSSGHSSSTSISMSTTTVTSGVESTSPEPSESTTSNASVAQSTTQNASGFESTTSNASVVQSATPNASGFESTSLNTSLVQRFESTSLNTSLVQSTTPNALGFESTTSNASVVQSTTPYASGFESTTLNSSLVQSTTSNASGFESTPNTSVLQSTTPNASVVKSTSQNAFGFESTTKNAPGFESTTKHVSGIESTTSYAPVVQSEAANASALESTTPSASAVQSTAQNTSVVQSTTPNAPVVESTTSSVQDFESTKATENGLTQEAKPDGSDTGYQYKPTDSNPNQETTTLDHTLLTEKMKTAELSKTKQKSESATDERPSSATVGYFGLAFLVSVFGSIVCADLLDFLGNRKR
ncbi:kxykxgkxw signal peptide domain protein [Plakobranchus ocellatus]|uniref:Kxykxgkxw signal peptide domain protein n=1 Tax=Plakobranchus ocellatus TaxID=259542 RepID=A0AAV3Y1L3_9GAST|nr:kxykxgkxw signal peptide domain protein [Plakobranchus ocellatus]